MAELNLGRINRRVSDIEENLRILRRYSERPEQEFLANQEALGAAKYAFVVAIEAAVSIAAHLCAKLLSRSPASQRDSFEMLGEAGILPADLAGELAKMASFRNLLVHGYAEVNNVTMLAIMRERLGDLERFVRRVADLSH